jgi:murein L,D-transpeptidase YcbB/YkuD
MKNKRLTHITRNGQQIVALWLLLACLGAGVPAAAAAEAGVLRGLLTPALAAHEQHPASGPLTAGELAAFYAARDYRPLWSDPAAQRALYTALEDLLHDGLNPAHYMPRVSVLADDSPCSELMLTAAWLQAQLHLRFGALDRATIEPLWRLRPATMAAPRQALLAEADAFAADPAAALHAARPDLPVYHSLRLALSDVLSQSEAQPWPRVPAGALLRPGQPGALALALP